MIWTTMYLILLIPSLLLLFLLSLIIFVVSNVRTKILENRGRYGAGSSTVGFFHPYCNGGAGGERVLWCAVQALQRKYPSVKILIYTGDTDASPQEILSKVERRFNIQLADIEFVYLHKRYWVEAKRYPYFTLLGQSIGSIVLGLEALQIFAPQVFIDTTGYAFAMPFFSMIGGCEIVSYVHYPTITEDMLKVVTARQPTYNNRKCIARNPILTFAKLVYYRIFALLYKFAGSFNDVIMVNSSWTEEHINSLWKSPMMTHKVYPPCETKDLELIPLKRDPLCEKIKIVSVAQFRREKNHPMQLKLMYELRQLVSEEVWEKLELVLIGSTRNTDDEEWLKDMRDLAKHYSIEDNVSFKINLSYDELKRECGEGLIGLHTMWNEHFGIGIVECMAAGLIMIAHRSGGPMLDIIEEYDSSRNGFLASDEQEYAQIITKILMLPEEKRNKIREFARSSVSRFSSEVFQENFLRVLRPVMNSFEGSGERCDQNYLK